MQITDIIVFASGVIKTMGYLVTYDPTNVSIIDWPGNKKYKNIISFSRFEFPFADKTLKRMSKKCVYVCVQYR